MKKIPTLYTRVFDKHRIVEIKDEITPGCEEAFLKGRATVKFDGSCCAIINGVFYKRYDAKKLKVSPPNSIPCSDRDPVTGHWPHWVPVDPDSPADKWFREAFKNSVYSTMLPADMEGTYEAIGPHFQGNPHKMKEDTLTRHGLVELNPIRDFEHIKQCLENHPFIEGLVFWLDGEPVCKIKRTDFGMRWDGKSK
jgi:hypothetical protein